MTEAKDYTDPISTPMTYPGTLRGYRNFGNPIGWNDERFIRPTYSYNYYPVLNPGETWWNASCGTDIGHIDVKGYKAPHSSCKCGFYANYYPHQTFYKDIVFRDLPRGVVECAGKIILGRKGFRAEKMRLIAISTTNEILIKKIKDEFPTITLFSNNFDLHEAYPQEDLTSLLGEALVAENLSSSEPDIVASEDFKSYLKKYQNHFENMQTLTFDSFLKMYKSQFPTDPII